MYYVSVVYNLCQTLEQILGVHHSNVSSYTVKVFIFCGVLIFAFFVVDRKALKIVPAILIFNTMECLSFFETTETFTLQNP